MKLHHEIAKILLDNGADPDAKDYPSDTPLHYLCEGSSIESESDIKIMHALIKAGADLNAVTEYNGKTPLHYAVEGNKVEFIEILIKAGADLSIKDKEGKTPTDLASDEIKELIRSLSSK